MKKPTQSRLNSGRPMPPKEYQFKPGQSGNPGGRPRKKPFLAEIEKIIEKHPEEIIKIVQSMFKRAKSGSVTHFRELADRTDGPVVQKQEVELTVVQELAERIEKARKRVRKQ